MFIVAYGTGPGSFHIVCCTHSAEEAVIRCPFEANIWVVHDGFAYLELRTPLRT